jgi:peroxiredoxin
MITPHTPRKPVPELPVPTVDGGQWTLAERRPPAFTLLAFYRGLHCPICKGYLGDLERHAAALGERGVEVIAISTDVEERAREAKSGWELASLEIGYGLAIDKAREWGLFISTSRGKTSVGIEEPALFSEPGLFLVQADGTLYFSSVQTMPFARPHFADIVGAVDFVTSKGYPARGEA